MEKDKQRILIYENNILHAVSLRIIFRDAGYRTMMVNSGLAVVNLIQSYANSKNPFDLLVSKSAFLEHARYNVISELDERKLTIPILIIDDIITNGKDTNNSDRFIDLKFSAVPLLTKTATLLGLKDDPAQKL